MENGSSIPTIELRSFKEVDLKDGVVIDGFPSVGLVSTIAANYLIAALNLDQVAALESFEFPPTSMIFANKPKFPARIYASEDHRLTVFFAEFSPHPRLYRPLANLILSWAESHGCRLIISPEGLPTEKLDEEEEDGGIWAVASTDNGRKQIEKAGLEKLEIGMITGVTGILLNEGRWRGFDVISLLAEARVDRPDAMAAARTVIALDKLLPEVEIEARPLIQRAKMLEEQIRQLRSQAKHIDTEPVFGMYR